MAYTFRPAEPDEVEAVFRLYADRIRWMEKKGIRQWNVTGYLEAYPIRYYMRRQSHGDLFVLVSDDTVTGAVVLLQEDDRWPDGADHTALYIHHLVTDPRVSGAGRVLLAEAEGAALQQKKRAIRLDCAADNAFLNGYYASLGYRLAGICREGPYAGNRLEKVLIP